MGQFEILTFSISYQGEDKMEEKKNLYIIRRYWRKGRIKMVSNPSSPAFWLPTMTSHEESVIRFLQL